MEIADFLSVFLMVSLLCSAKCDESTEIYYERLDLLENEMKTFTNRSNIILHQLSVDKSDLRIELKRQVLSLKTELKTNIRQHVNEALSGILKGESIEYMIRSQVFSEVRHLKRSNHQMKRELHQLEKALRHVQDNMNTRETLQKGERETSELMTCSRCLVKSELLTVQLADRDSQIRELNKKLGECKVSEDHSTGHTRGDNPSKVECSNFRNTDVTKELAEHDRQISELNQTLRTHVDVCKPSNITIIKEIVSALEATTLTPTVSSTTTSVPTTTRLATPEPIEERNRILVAPWSRSAQFRQFNVKTTTFDIYPYLSLMKYDCVAYVSQLNSLLIGLYRPNRIIISELDTSNYEIIRNKIRTRGIAADEGRGMVFLTTENPTTISKMTLRGNDFSTLVRISSSNPRAIAVNPKIKTVYACAYDELFTVFYDGTALTTLDTGSGMHSVTLDIMNGILYYGKRKRLMKMSLTTEVISEVTQFNFCIWNLVSYQDRVYYSSCSKKPGVLGAVDVGQNIVSNTLQTMNMAGADIYSICLIP